MKVVNLSDPRGEIKQRYVGFSILFLFFGPFYLLANIHIFSGLFLLLLYYYLLPIPGMYEFSYFISQYLPKELASIVGRFLVFFRGEFATFIGIGVVIFLQIFISFFIEGYILKRIIKRKKLLPITEEDARLLISLHACKRNIPLADSRIQSDIIENYQMNIDVPFIVDENNSQISIHKKAALKRKLDELNQLYQLQQMTREEYEVRRNQIIQEFKK